MKIGIANDHRGLSLKIAIVNYLKEQGIEYVNYGTDTTDSVDYPDYAEKLCVPILEDNLDLGIIICGTGIGVSIACNKIKGIRCAKTCNPIEASLARAHNDANVLAISGHIDKELALDIVSEFIETTYTNDERHVKRLEKIALLENK